MKLEIDRGAFDAMVAAAYKASPLEACGILGGRGDCASEFHELTNADRSGEHFRMLPEEQFAAVRDLRAKGCKMLAIWHSHPATPARMSDEDLRLAYTPDVAYVIVSLADPTDPTVAGFVVENGEALPIDLPVRDRREGGG